MKTVIIGGVAGGASCAARLRRLDEKAEIVMIERTHNISYATCGLPYFLSGVISDESDLAVQTPQSLFSRFNIDVRVRSEATDIDKENKTVTVKDLESGKEYKESYDFLVLSTGAVPVVPDIKSGKDKVFLLRTVEDSAMLKDHISKNGVGSAVVLGGGFIGIETAENLKEAGIKVTLVQGSSHMFPPFDEDMAGFIHAKLRERGIEMLFDMRASFIEQDGGKVFACCKNGKKAGADIIVCAIGVAPENQLAEKAGIKTGIKGCIITNEYMQTSEKDIYACGDAVAVINGVTKKSAHIPLAGPANKQGRIIADNICSLNSEYKHTLGASVIKIFDMTAASVGINEKTAKQNGIEYEKIVLSPFSHATYYPGATLMTFKVLFDKNTFEILGAQIVGESADKRADVIATAMKAGMKAYELKDVELCYAPPYSSAKDPVNMAGFIAENVKKGIIKHIHADDIENAGEDVFLLDTRTPAEFARGHAQGFYNIPVDSLRERLCELPKDKKIYVMCQSGLRSYIASRILIGSGFDAYNYSGGYRFYSLLKGDEKFKNTARPCGKED